MSRRAKARLLYPEIFVSERLGGLGSKVCHIYTWLLAAADDQGRSLASPRRIKTLVLPFVDDLSADDVEEGLKRLEKVGLIILYPGSDGRPLLQFERWFDHQGGLPYKSASLLEPPPGWEEDQVSEQKARDGQGRFTRQPKARPAQEACPECGVVIEPGKSVDPLDCSCGHHIGKSDADGRIIWTE